VVTLALVEWIKLLSGLGLRAISLHAAFVANAKLRRCRV
jgi:hypothetical protein